jgi:NAD-dependent histone deacetylase SIR2
MLIIMGTSLKVHGLKKLVKDFAKTVHASSSSSGKPLSPKNTNRSTKSWTGKVIFVNRTPPPAGEWSDIIDYHVEGETDMWVDKVVEDWKKMRPADWEVQKTLDGVDGEDSPFKVVKDIPMVKAKGRSFEVVHWMCTDVVFVSAGKKKPDIDAENIPPSELPSEPISKPNQVTPVSPSKRRQAASHYSDVECSPSKKRDITVGIEKLAIEDRGLLFGNDSTNAKIVGVYVEVAGVKPTASSRRVKAAKVITEKKNLATK